MDCVIDKKGGNAVSGWTPRCYRLRNCEFIQYKKGITDFVECTDKMIKKRYNIYDVNGISIGQTTPYIVGIHYGLNDDDDEEDNNITLKFNDINKRKGSDHLLFCAYYRILCCSSKCSYNLQCDQRPIPSNICFALYYLLQKLYKHQDIISTQYVFQKRLKNTSSIAHVEKLYYNLIVNSKKFVNLNEKYGDIHLLTQTLRYTLYNMPTSLLCDSYCNKLTDFVCNIIEKAENEYKIEDKEYYIKIQQLPGYTDKDIYVLKKQHLDSIKEKMLEQYAKNKKEYKNKNGFTLFNRYGFMVILFLLLNNVSSSINYKKTTMTAKDLALTFSECLQNKRYSFNNRTDALYGYPNKRKNKKYENNFIKMLKILIFYAKDLFPDLLRVSWKLTTLIHAQGNEKVMVKRYNDLFSRDTKNEYFMTEILNKKKNYGDFDGAYYDEKINDEYKTTKQQKYIIQKRSSYHEIPAYHSDLGISDNDILSDDDKEEQKYTKQIEYGGRRRENNYNYNDNDNVYTSDVVTFDDEDDGYLRDDEYEKSYQPIPRNTGYDGPYHNNNNNNNNNKGDKQQILQEMEQEIDNNYNYNNNDINNINQRGSWWIDCDFCLYAPLRSLFGGGGGNGGYHNNNNNNNNNQQTYGGLIGNTYNDAIRAQYVVNHQHQQQQQQQNQSGYGQQQNMYNEAIISKENVYLETDNQYEPKQTEYQQKKEEEEEEEYNVITTNQGYNQEPVQNQRYQQQQQEYDVNTQNIGYQPKERGYQQQQQQYNVTAQNVGYQPKERGYGQQQEQQYNDTIIQNQGYQQQKGGYQQQKRNQTGNYEPVHLDNLNY